MYREFYLRNRIGLGLSDADPNDIILLSDADEIPVLSDMDLSNDLFIFKQDCMQLKLNLLNPGLTPFYGSKGIRYQYLGWPAEFRIHDRPYIKMDMYNNLKKQIIQSGGWHFSYCSSVKDILYKVSSYAHNERAEFISPQHIDDCIINKKDIWGGQFNYALNTDRLLPYDIKKLPAYVQNNIDRFKDLLSL
jgi:beta-1,4-mannosyl-glycoprotein beta-1,4-N-acetylglucosaminyltransferase